MIRLGTAEEFHFFTAGIEIYKKRCSKILRELQYIVERGEWWGRILLTTTPSILVKSLPLIWE
jgi:hypothetical protein